MQGTCLTARRCLQVAKVRRLHDCSLKAWELMILCGAVIKELLKEGSHVWPYFDLCLGDALGHDDRRSGFRQCDVPRLEGRVVENWKLGLGPHQASRCRPTGSAHRRVSGHSRCEPRGPGPR